MKFPRLCAASLALALGAGALAVATVRARALERASIHALAPRLFSLRTLGTALQAEAFRTSDLLPFLGSSGLLVQNRYHANTILRDYPTGFTTFPIGMAETSSIFMLKKLAALGPEVRGKKLAISLSPGWFFFYGKAPDDAYAANYSRLHAGALAFSSDLTWDLKRAAALRMLEYPATLAGDPILKFGLQRLAGGSLFDRCLYYAIKPIGHLQNGTLRLQDHWTTYKLIRDRPYLTAPTRGPLRPIDWAQMLAEADAVGAQQMGENPFGFDHELWQEESHRWKDRKLSDEGFAAGMKRSNEWSDFELLLRGLEQLGARPLILSMPTSGLFLEHLGTAAASRQPFYARIQSMAEAHRFKVMTFAEHDRAKGFVTDPSDHLGPKGWVHYGQALEKFRHELPQ